MENEGRILKGYSQKMSNNGITPTSSSTSATPVQYKSDFIMVDYASGSSSPAKNKVDSSSVKKDKKEKKKEDKADSSKVKKEKKKEDKIDPSIVKKEKKKKEEKDTKKDDKKKEKKKKEESDKKRKSSEVKDVKEKTRKKKKEDESVTTPSSSSSSISILDALHNAATASSTDRTIMEVSSHIDAEMLEMMKFMFGFYTEQITVQIKCMTKANNADWNEEIVVAGDSALVNGNRFFDMLDWNDTLSDSQLFFNFNCILTMTRIACGELLNLEEVIESMKESLQATPKLQFPFQNDVKISTTSLDYSYKHESSIIEMIFKDEKDVHAITRKIYSQTMKEEQTEAEELAEEEGTQSLTEEPPTVTLNFTFSQTGDAKQYAVTFQTISCTSYKKFLSTQLRIEESDLTNYKEEVKDATTVEASAILSNELFNTLMSQVADVKLVHRHVFYEQRLISYQLFERMKIILGNEHFSTFNHLAFLICTPDQNTLWNQTMERLKRTGILNEKQVEMVSIKYRKDHFENRFTPFRNRIEKEKDTLFVLIADECHYAITKDGAHDMIVNDTLATNQDNFFVLLVSATPYNVLSIDSNIPEMYKVKQEVVLQNGQITAGSIVRVTSTKYHRNGLGTLVKPYLKEGPIQVMKGKLGASVHIVRSPLFDQAIENGPFYTEDIVQVVRVEHGYRIISIQHRLEILLEMTERDFRKKMGPLTNVFLAEQQMGTFNAGDLVEVVDSIKWEVTFCLMDDPSISYTVNDWEFNSITGYEEFNVIRWSDVQANQENVTQVAKTEKDNSSKKYFSKQDYIKTMKTDNSLVLKGKLLGIIQ